MTDTETAPDVIGKQPLPDEAAVEPQEEAATEQTTETDEEESREESQEDSQEETGEGDSDEEEAEPERPKRRRNRTAKLAAKLTNAEQKIAALERQLQSVPKSQPAADEPAPKLEDFGKYEDYVSAHAAYVARNEARKEMQGLNARVEEATRQVETRQQEAEWNKREAKAREKYADYDEVVHTEELTITPVMAAALKQMDDGTDVAYHLGEHPDTAARIAQLSEIGQIVELGRIATKLARPKPKSTSAPNPVRTVKSGAAPQGLTPHNARTIEDYAKARGLKI